MSKWGWRVWFIEVFPVKVAFKLIFEEQLGANRKNIMRVGKSIPYWEKNKYKGPVVGRNKVRSGN